MRMLSKTAETAPPLFPAPYHMNGISVEVANCIAVVEFASTSTVLYQYSTETYLDTRT